MLGKATTNDFKGATLVCVHRGQAYQVRRGTNVVADVSEFFLDEGFSNDVIDQNFNSTTGKDSYHGFWLKTLTFDDNRGNSFRLNGMIEERYKAPVPQRGNAGCERRGTAYRPGHWNVEHGFRWDRSEGRVRFVQRDDSVLGQGSLVPLNTF